LSKKENSITVALDKARAAKKEGATKVVITGPWAFTENDEALQRRTSPRFDNHHNNLFGMVENKSAADVLSGDFFGDCWDMMRTPVDRTGKLKPPQWSVTTTSTLDKNKNKKQSTNNVRSYLPRLAIGTDTEIKLNSGIYYFSIQYENKNQMGREIHHHEAAIIVGEMAFDNRGIVTAAGADWDTLFTAVGGGGGKQQTKVKEASSRLLLRPSLIRRSSSNLKTKKQLKWYSSKISEDWKDGDTLNFKIDTFRNTVVYTIQGRGDKEVRTGVKLSNILSFTNNHTFPHFLQVFAYCGGGGGCDNTSSRRSSNQKSIIYMHSALE